MTGTLRRILPYDLKSIFADCIEKGCLPIDIDFVEAESMAEENFCARLFA